MGKRIKTVGVNGIADESFFLGYAGERDHTILRIVCTGIYADYPDAVITLRVRPPDGDTYNAEITAADGVAAWTLNSADTANAGNGEYQLIFTDHGTEIFRSAIGHYRIGESLPVPENT